MNENHVVIFSQHLHDRAGRSPGMEATSARGPGNIHTPQTAASRTCGASRRRLETEPAKRRHIGHLPAGGDQGVDLALPNPSVFRVMDHSHDESRTRAVGTAPSPRLTQRESGHHKSWTLSVDCATPRVSKKRRETAVIAPTS